MEIKRYCYACQETKDIDMFHNCKKDKKHGKTFRCKSCCKKYSIETTEKRKEYYKKNYDLEKAKERVYNWRIEKYGDKKAIREQKKIDKQILKEQKEKERIYNKNVLLPLKKSIRSNLWLVFKNKKIPKKLNSTAYLGCGYEILVKHIESQFVKGMDWNNKFLWHIDHIVPLRYAKTEEELIQLCHYTNIQPLWANDNLKKRGIIPKVSNIYFKKTFFN